MKDANGRDCGICHHYLPWTEFNKGDNRCKVCLKVYRRSESYRAASRARGQQNYADPVLREQMKSRSKNYLVRLKAESSEANSDAASRVKAVEQLQRLKDSARESAKQWRKEHPELARAQTRKQMKKWMSNPRNRLSSNVSALIRSSLARNVKNGRHWETLVPYTLDALKAHLEALWEPSMTWDNHTDDGWHIDHIKPVSSFTFASPDDQGFKDCWALVNLAPRWATTEIARRFGSTQTGNLNKSDSVIASVIPVPKTTEHEVK